jgi:hypothetical protein
MHSMQTIDFISIQLGVIIEAMKLNTQRIHDTETHASNLKSSIARPYPIYPKFDIASGSDIDAHLRMLIELNEDGNLFFSIYLDLSSTQAAEHQLRELVRSILPTLSELSIDHLFSAESYILDIIGDRIRDEYKGLAVHFRGGPSPEVYAIAFHIPVKPAIFADQNPNILQLIEMRDSYDRYVVLVTTATQARIMEIVVGTVTREAWLKRPDLRKRIRGEWSVEHYRNHQREKTNQFINEKIDILKRLFSKGGYSHLILAGDSKRIAMIEKNLPDYLRKKIVDICNLDLLDDKEKIVRKTIQLFVEQESIESQTNLERLERTILSGGGGVAGLDACEGALNHNVIETLIMTKSASPKRQKLRAFTHRNPDGNYLTIEKRRQRILENAIKSGTRIEFIDGSSFIDDYCGVGAILRYRGAEFACVEK